jgi:hypothetical protein
MALCVKGAGHLFGFVTKIICCSVSIKIIHVPAQMPFLVLLKLFILLVVKHIFDLKNSAENAKF